jgi:endonuclease YncB( thermonuclease family)
MDGYGGSATVKWVASTLSVLLLSSNGWCADFTGSVVSVLDGDTIEVLHTHHAERIRLNGIDCPNYSQVAPHHRVAFNSAAEAEGRRLARRSSPQLLFGHSTTDEAVCRSRFDIQMGEWE